MKAYKIYMKNMLRFFLSRCLFLIFLIAPTFVYAADSLLQQDDLTFLGSFRVPHSNGLVLGGAGLTFRSGNGSGSLILNGHNGATVEISIPTPVVTSLLENMNTANIIQPASDLLGLDRNKTTISGGTFPDYTTSITGNGSSTGGFLVYNNKLLGSVFPYYDGSLTASLSHYWASLDWGQGGWF